MIKAICPECDSVLHFASQLKGGDRIVCQSCRSTLCVLLEDPITLDWAFIEPITNQDDRLDQKSSAESTS